MSVPLDVRHGLCLDKVKGYKLRLTISRGTKLVGKRVQVWLHTRDESLAIVKRDAILAGYRGLGLTIIQHAQCKRADFKPMPPADGPEVKAGKKERRKQG
jgi:hypothetical protein